MPKDFALYKGDTFLTLGSRKELAAYLGVTADTITFYSSPSYKKRVKEDGKAIVVIRIEDDEENEEQL